MLNFLGRRGAKEAFYLVSRWDSKAAKECKSDRSRQEIFNEYVLAKIDFDTAENEPSKVCEELVRRIELDQT